jgi:hypothetical protein
MKMMMKKMKIKLKMTKKRKIFQQAIQKVVLQLLRILKINKVTVNLIWVLIWDLREKSLLEYLKINSLFRKRIF